MIKKTDIEMDSMKVEEIQGKEVSQEDMGKSISDLRDDIADVRMGHVSEDEGLTAAILDEEVGESALDIAIAERDVLKDQLLRALAETENMRRRSEREADTARKYGHTQFARDLVDAIDNLARALASAPPDKSALDESTQSLLTGIDLSWTEIQTVIEKHGVRQISPLGEKFDYNFHQAMFEVPTNDQPPGIVLEVIQHGYALHDRLLRPAMVGVSKSLDTNEAAPEKS
jgi:molecular chaperone GrpE